MTQPSYQVIVYFGTTATASTTFTLDDPTRGVLDSPTYTLGGDTGTDIAGDAFYINAPRGRTSLIFENIDAGTAVVQLINRTRKYDPLYAAGPYYGNLKPGKRVTILANGVPIFDGKVTDWNLSYDVSGESIATLYAEDALGTIGRQALNAFTATASQTASSRLTSVLNRSEVAWSGGARDFDTGVSTLQADVVTAGTNVLNYCQLVAKSDGGVFFASRVGVLTFRDRRANITGAPAVTFADDGTGTEFGEVGVSTGSDNFYTRVIVARQGGTAQTYTTASATDDGLPTLTMSGMLQDSDAQALDMATYLATVYATGEARVSSVGVDLAGPGMTSTQIQTILALDLNNVVRVKWTPNQVGTQIDAKSTIAGIRHVITPSSHMVTMTLDKYDNRAPFILDSTTNGVLDGTSVLIF